MNKKALRYAFNSVLEAAGKLECDDFNHELKNQHKVDVMCPVEYELAKQISIVKSYMEENLK